MAYDETYFTARESWRDWRIEAQALLDLARVTRAARVLEIGCGGGGLLRMARARGAIAFGVDTLNVALNLARERLSLRAQFANQAPASQAEIASSHPSTALRTLLAMTGEGTLPFRDQIFDALITQHVVEHIDDLDRALREWKRVLKRGGRIALATPNARYPDPAHFADADHARVFAPDELRATITRAGFVVEACVTIFPFLTRARFLRAFGVIAYRAFARAPYFASRGRTILLGARRMDGSRDKSK